MKICLLNENNPSLSLLFKESFNIECPFIDVLKALDKNIRFLCAIDNDRVIGSIMITTKYDPVKNINSYYLDYVSVLKEYQHQGIGTNMLREVENMARSENISYIEFTSNKNRTNARKLYLSSGYSQRDTEVFYKRIDRGNYEDI